MLFFRIFEHLLPRSAAWRLTITKTLRKFFDGLTAEPENARDFVDEVYRDAFPATTRELEEWESQFGIYPLGNEAARRLTLAAHWSAQGGQSPRYIQDTLQAAGFPLYIHEWWTPPGPPYVARDPRLYTVQPLIGSYQCTGDAFIDDQPQCTGAGITQPQCNAFLANEPGYIVNRDLTPRAPPPVPDDPFYWPYFLYFGAATFPNRVTIPLSQRDALERLILKIRPTQHWIVMLVDYDAGAGIFDDSFSVEFN